MRRSTVGDRHRGHDRDAGGRESRYAGPGGLNTVIQHEMGHVVDALGRRPGHRARLVHRGHRRVHRLQRPHELGAYRIDDTRAYVQSGKWTGKCYLTKEITATSVLTGSAAYGIGYLAFKRLAGKYGPTKMLDFWGDVERDGTDPEQRRSTRRSACPGRR